MPLQVIHCRSYTLNPSLLQEGMDAARPSAVYYLHVLHPQGQLITVGQNTWNQGPVLGFRKEGS